MLFQASRMEHVIRRIERIAGKKFYKWDDGLTTVEILHLWKHNLPIPFEDQCGNKYVFLKKDDVCELDSSKEKSDINKLMSFLNIETIESAARGESSVSFRVDSLSLMNRLRDFFEKEEDVNLESINNNEFSLQWDI